MECKKVHAYMFICWCGFIFAYSDRYAYRSKEVGSRANQCGLEDRWPLDLWRAWQSHLGISW